MPINTKQTTVIRKAWPGSSQNPEWVISQAKGIHRRLSVARKTVVVMSTGMGKSRMHEWTKWT